MKFVEPQTGAPISAEQILGLATALGTSRCLDSEGVEFAVHTVELSYAVSILEQLAAQLHPLPTSGFPPFNIPR